MVRRALSSCAPNIGGGGGCKILLAWLVKFYTFVPLSAIRRSPTHQDTIEQGVLSTVLSACELLRAVNHWLLMI